MKNFGKLAVLGAALAVSATYASATPVVAGSLDYSNDLSSTMEFTGSGSALTLTFSGAADVTAPVSGFAGVSEAYDVVFPTSPINLSSLPATTIFTVSEAGPPTNVINFIATSASVATPGGFTDITFYGTVEETVGGVVYTSAPGTLTLDTQGAAGTAESYSGTLSTNTPEPSSLILLGTGLIGSAGMLMRRRRLTA